MRTETFDYRLPKEAIAQVAVEPRDAARLLVVPTLEDRVFTDLPSLLRAGDLLVVNNTRVRASRLRGVKVETGGAIELLLTRRVNLEQWEALSRPARNLRAGTKLEFDGINGTVITPPVDGVVLVALAASSEDVEDLLPKLAEVPLPPYFKGTLDDLERYQTVYASRVGSAAAPTAGLHFTPSLIERLRIDGVDFAEINLEVGLDTFHPIHTDVVSRHRIHRERYSVSGTAAAAVERCRKDGGRVVAVGTTTVRTLETAATAGRMVKPAAGETDLFITPGYVPRVVDAVVTNFHAPRTTLMVMIAALIGSAWREAYKAAIARGYRFLSFGDAMMITQFGRSP